MKCVKPYVVDEVPSNRISGNKEPVYYCHHREYPDMPVFGSIGTLKRAKEICKAMNDTRGYME